MFIGCYFCRRVLAPFCRHFYFQQLFLVEPGISRGLVLLLGGECERVAVFAADGEVPGQVVRGLRHGVVAVLLQERLVGETPAKHCVVHLLVAIKAGFRLVQHPGPTAHALHAAGNEQLPLGTTDRPGCIQGRRSPAAAQAIDSHAAHRGMHAGQQGGITRDVTTVLTRLVGIAEDHVFHQAAIDAAPVQQRLDDGCRQVVRPFCRQPSAITAEGGADPVIDNCLIHLLNPDGLTVLKDNLARLAE